MNKQLKNTVGETPIASTKVEILYY